nr:uncharacterized protein LOC113805867 [Penaeus vannamei]
MNLVDSFTLFMSVTSQDDATVTSSYPLLNHPITPHLTSVSVCPPTLNTLLEAMLFGRGFSLSREYLQKARSCFVQLTNLLDMAPPTSLARLVQATARVACDIRHTSLMKKEVTEDGNEDASKSETADKENEKCERDTNPTSSSAVSLWMRYPPYSETMSDEEIVTQALYAVTSPLQSEKEALWRQEFNKIFELEDAEDQERNHEPCDVEVAIKEVLLEWGYGDADDTFLGGESELAYEVPDESDIIKATQEGQQMIAEDTADKKEKEKEVQNEEGGKEMEGNLAEKEKELSSHGASIMKAALHMYSLLTIHHCCCIMAPSGSGKSVVWKVLAEALNRKKQKEGNDGSFRGVAWRVLQCGAFTRDHLLGNWDEERRMWRKGVLFHTLTELQQSPGECWLVLVGPFSQDILKSVSHLCHTSPTFKDEALNQVILEGDIRVIIEQSDEKNLISHARVRCPVLKLPTEAMTASGAAGRAMKRLLKVLPHLQGQREISEARTLVAEGLVNLELPQTSLSLVPPPPADESSRMRISHGGGAGDPCHAPGELLEVLQQVLELLHTARHPHLHQDAREGAYTPARLGSRSPAPSDAFLDYANRVVATPELQAALTLLPQLLDVTCPILLYAKPGHGLTTFLDIFERHRAPATRVIRFRCTPLSTAHELFSCMIGDLLPSTPPTDQSATSSGSDGENPIHDCLDPSMSQRDAFENIPILAPGDEGFSLLILEDVHLQLDSGGTLGTIWEIFRHMVEYGEVVCPSSGTRYRLQRVVPLLALSCHALPDQNVPARILRHCVVMGVPCISSRSCEHVVKVSLQDVLAELDEENFQPDATRDVVVELYQGLGQSSRPQTGSRPRTASRTRASSRPQTASRSRPSSRPQTASRSRASSRPRTASRPQTASRPATAEPPDEATEGPLSGPASDKGSAKDSFDLPDLDTSTSNGSRLDTGRKSRSASPRNTLPNLHHLLQLTEALRKNARLLQMTIGQSASLIAFEAGRIFSSVVESEEELSDRVFKIVKNKFEEVEEGLAWWPGQTEEGKKMMIHAKDYNEFVKNIQYPDGLQQIMFTQAHFMALLKLVITMETFWSHAVVVGPPGVGKLSLVKLAAHYTRARVYHLDDYRDEASRVGAVRSAVEASGVGGRRTVVVVRDHSVTPQLLDVLHSLAHTGWSETLLGRLRLRGLLEAIRLKGKELPRENKWMTYLEEDEVSSLRHRLITNVKRHLHVCLVSHSRHTTDSWCERYPPLRSRWSWVRLDRWDSDTLRQVARRILLPYDIPPHILHQMQAALPSIHLMLAREKGVTVTVSDYVEACRVTVTLLARRRTELRESLALFKGGMDKLQETGVNVEELKGELNELEPELKATQDEGNRLTQALAQHRNQVAQLRDQMVAQEERVKEKNDSVAAMNDEITQEVGEAMPALEATEKAVKALDKKDLVEVRVLNKPPDLVLAVMEPICILLNVKPDWASMKTLLGDPNMTKKLMEVEKDTISDATLRKLKKYTENPKFIPDEVAKVSKPCRPLCAWLKALDHYSQVLRNVEPKKLKLVELERELNGLQLDQRQLQQQLGQSERELAELQARYEACVCRRQQLDGGIKRATARLQRCTRLTTVLADEDSRWSAKIKFLVSRGGILQGLRKSFLVSRGGNLQDPDGRSRGRLRRVHSRGVAVAYLGALTSAHRDQLLQNVVNILVTSGVVTPAKYDLMETLSTAEQRDTWEAADLYRDPACFLQAALVLSAIRRPLVLDPDYMCVRWLTPSTKNKEASRSSTPATRTFSVKSSPPPTPAARSSSSTRPRTSRTTSGNSLRFRVIFSDVLKMEREDLYEQRASLTASIMRDQKALEAVDDTILKKLTQASTALLDNEELLAAFYEAKSTSAEFRTRLSECRRTLQKIGNVRDKYRPVATRGRLLFSTSTALRRLSRNYVFSFQHFLHLFSVCITSGGRTETLSFDQRIHSLVVSVTQLVVTHVSRALHPAHRLAFTTALCAAISADAGTLTPPAWRAVLDPSVLDERALVEAVMDLEVDFGGVGEDLLKGVRLQLSLHDLVTEVGLTGSRGPAEMPRGRISDFNALMLLRIAKPRQLVAGAREVVNIMLGDPHLLRPDLAKYLKEHLFNVLNLGCQNTVKVLNVDLHEFYLIFPSSINYQLTEVFRLGPEERKLPVLVWADYGRDVAGEVIGAAHARSVAGITRVIMATPAEKAGELDSVGVPHLASLLVNSVQQGGWIIVQGAESPSVLSTLLGAMTSLGSPDVKVHEDFRLVVTVSVTKAAPPDLTLLARPLYSQPAPTIPATLAAAATLINMHNYRHHYSGARWRRAVWQVAAAHTIASVTRHWHGHPPPPSVPPTHTPRTQIASGPSRPSSASPLPPTPTPTPELLDEPEARPSPGHVGLDGYVNLEELTETLKCLYKLSLDYALDDDTVVHFLAVVYGQQRAWQEIVYSIPGEVGVVSKEAAQSIVTAHLTACLQDLHNLTLDVEYRAFQDDLTTIASDIFEAPTSALDE